MTPSLTGYLLLAGIVGTIGACAVSYTAGRASRAAEISALTAVSEAMSARNRQITQEVASAQQAYVKTWVAARDANHAKWVRIRASIDRGVPAIQVQCPSVREDPGTELGGTSGTLTADEAAAAFEVGRKLSNALDLCREEARKCESMR